MARAATKLTKQSARRNRNYQKLSNHFQVTVVCLIYVSQDLTLGMFALHSAFY